jgi:prepilin-type N-terminal cleavage/methylation domain-containing protein
MIRMAPRAGVTLIELLVTLFLTAILISIAGASLQRVLAVQSETTRADGRRTALTDALHTLVRHAASADPARGDLRSVRDTALEFTHAIGSATVCRAAGDTLVITGSADSLPWSATLPRAVTDDDALRVWHDADARWITRRTRTAGTATGACGDSGSTWPDRATQRLLLDAPTAGMRPGAIVRVLQHERWSLVRSADGTWSLALATWDEARNTFGVPQPLLAPLAPPAGDGLRARALDALGTPLADSALPRTRTLLVAIRYAPTARRGAITDSVRIDVGTH